MTPTNGLPARPMPTATTPRQAGEAKAPAQGAAAAPAEGQAQAQGQPQDFAALFQALAAGAELGAAIPAAEGEGEAAAGTTEELLPRRPREGKTRSFRPEELLPPELLLTLYPQMANPQPTAQPLVALAEGNEASAAAIAAAIAAQPAAAGEQLPEAALSAGAGAQAAASTPARTDASFAAALASSAMLGQPAAAAWQPVAAQDGGEPAPASIQTAATAAAPAAPAMQPAIAPTPAPSTPRPAHSDFIPPSQPEERPVERPTAEVRTEAPLPAPARPEGGPEEGAGSGQRIRNTEVTVLRQETALPPAGQPPIAHQAAAGIIAEIEASSADAARETAAAAQRDAASSPAKVLHIQLDPPELGVLTVRLSLRDNALQVSVEAAEHRTAALLEADRERLTDMLRQAGFSVDNLTVAPAPPTDKSSLSYQNLAGQGAENAATPGGGSGQQNGPQAGGAQPDAQRGQSSPGGRDQGLGSGRPSEEGNHAANPARPADGDVYI